MSKKIEHLSTKTLFEMGDAMAVQNSQLRCLGDEKGEINDGIDILEQNNLTIEKLHEEAEDLVDKIFLNMGDSVIDGLILESVLTNEGMSTEKSSPFVIKKTGLISTNNSWASYVDIYNDYAKRNYIALNIDPFLTTLSTREYANLADEIDGEFARKTSITNKTDLRFLAIATALQTVKALLFPIVAEKAGYGSSFDKDQRLAHDDKSIKNDEKRKKEAYKQEQRQKGNKDGEWLEILYRKPIYDTTKGSPNIGVKMEGGYHRIHTLGHDPILGWVFGTANILTDTITLDTFKTYQGARNPIRILPEQISLIQLFTNTVEVAKRHTLNLPAGIVAEGIHLKSDEFTKCGLPVPVLQTFAPEFAGKLYKNQYDALCFERDLKVIGTSATISMFIDMIITLVHSMYYDAEKDGNKDLFEVRTRKILLISNVIASTSNIIYSVVTENSKALDIGGLLVMISHLFRDTRFILNMKKEFVENRIYEKIEKELQSIEENKDKLFAFEYQNLSGVKLF